MCRYSTVRVVLTVSLSIVAALTGNIQLARGAQEPEQPSPKADTFAAEMRAGETALARNQFLSALEAFARANALRNKTSPEALLGMARASYGQSVFAESARSAERALKYVSGDRGLKAAIHYQRGLSLAALATGPDDPRLLEAAQSFQSAVALDPRLVEATYHAGAALLAGYRDVEGVNALQQYLAEAHDGPEAAAAKRLIDSPRRAREKFAAPRYSIAAADGATLDSARLKGKVVVLDFWGTWCPPCRANTPGLVQLYEKYKHEPVVFVGVGIAEKSADTWRSYIAEHGMNWFHTLDTGKADEIAQLFRVTAVPDYVVIDGDGIVRARLQDWGAEGPVVLERSIQRALATTAGTASTQVRGGGR